MTEVVRFSAYEKTPVKNIFKQYIKSSKNSSLK